MYLLLHQSIKAILRQIKITAINIAGTGFFFIHCGSINNNGMPVEIVQTLKKSGQAEKVIGAQLIKYKNFSGTRILPNELWQLGTTSALSDFTWSNIGGDGTFGNDARYYQTRVLGNYDTKGHLLEWNKTNMN